MIKIGISEKGIFSKETLLFALWAGILVSIVHWFLSFSGLDFVLDFFPELFHLAIIVFLTVIISKKLVIKFKGKEII